jgi:hypothetical protein
MKAFVVLAVVACANAAVLPYAGLPLAYNGALGYAGLPYAGAYGYAGAIAAAPVAAAPIAAAPIAAPSATQYSAQDEFGNINYGYSNINSAKHEVGNTYGGVTGSYSYVDANGLLQTVNYVADGLGFRVAGTNIPVAKSVDLAQPVFDLVGPAPVEDTEEVMAAKAEFQKAFDEAAAAAAPAPAERKRREILTIPASTAPLAVATPLTYAAAPIAAPLAYTAAAPIAAAPLAYTAAAPIAAAVSAPAAREAVLTKIQLNPGHAVAYIVN